jgi:FkbM family methyltransferase
MLQNARHRMEIGTMRTATRSLQWIGLRDRVYQWRMQRRRARRAAAETRGSDSRSRPALFEMDMKLNRIIDRDGGFFIEAGVNDGFTQSNTYWLERFRGWRGLLVEPMPELAAEARVSRPSATVIECALVSREHSGQHVRMRFGDLMSVVDGVREASWPLAGTTVALGWRDPYEIDVEGRALSELLDEIGAPEIDLLSLDVEGFEAEVLRGLDLERHGPRYLLVEINDPVRRPPLDTLFSERWVEHSWLSPMDLLYVRRDISDASFANPFVKPS